jgi:DNA-binding NarL/FixJ family response regulator
MKKSRILIVDDHPIFRKGLGQLINEEQDMEVCGEAEDFFSAVQKIKNLKPDLAIVDITLKDTSGLELIKYIMDNGINIPTLVLSMHDEKIFAERALKSGAKGYIMKQEMNERMLNNFLGRGVDPGTKNSVSDPAKILTGRELEIFRLMGRGYKRNEIGRALNLNVNTIGTYRERIKEKLDLNSSVDLLAQAIMWVRNTEEREIIAEHE